MLIPDAVRTLQRALAEIFGGRMQSLVVYGLRGHAQDRSHDHDSHATQAAGHGAPAVMVSTMAVVDNLSAEDLRACATRLASWHDQGLATPLLLATHEFAQALDAFPFEFGAILANHEVMSGTSPFEGVSVNPEDLRRACEVQARGHLLHLREGYLETLGNGDALSVLIVRSAPAFATLLLSVAKLDAGASGDDAAAAARAVERRLQLSTPTASDITRLVSVSEITAAEAERLFPAYLDATNKLVAYIDGWHNGR